MIHTLCRTAALITGKTVFRLKVYGKHSIPKRGGFIIAGNHVSYLDPIAIGISCPRKLNYMARHDLFSNRVFGWLLRNINVFPVKRDSADFKALKEAMRRVKQGQGLLVFPEGKRSKDGTLGSAQPGVGFLAAKLGVPVIPAFVRGTDKALPKGGKRITPTAVSVQFGKLIVIDKDMEYSDISEKIMDGIRLLSHMKHN